VAGMWSRQGSPLQHHVSGDLGKHEIVPDVNHSLNESTLNGG
jgi:hypothetical protein